MHHFRKAETLADKNTDSTALGWIYYGIGSAAFSAGRAAEALDACQRSLEMAARLHDDDLWMEAGEFFAGAMAWAGRIKEAFDHVDKVFECASRAGSAHHLMASAYVGASLSAALEDPKETRRRVDLGFNAKGIREAHFERRRLFQRLAWLNIMAGDLAEARRLMSEGLADSYYEGLIAFLEGDWEKAEAIQSKGLEESRIAGFGENVPQRLMELAAIRHARGDFGVAERLFLEGLRTAVESPNVVREFEIRLRLVVLLGEQRRTEDALLHLQRCRDLVALGIDWRGPSGRFETAEAVFAAAEARWTDANRHFAQAIEIFRRYELPWQIAENFTRWSRLLSSAGERIAAAEKVKRASEIYRSIAASASFVQRVLPRLAPTIESAGSESNSLQDQAVQSTAVAVLRPEGDYWTIAFNGASVRIKSSAESSRSHGCCASRDAPSTCAN